MAITKLKINARYFFIANLVLFQLGWFLAIFGGDAALLIIIPLILLHFILSPSRSQDFLAVFLAVLFGLLHDSLLIYVGILLIDSHNFLPPLWLISLWALLGITLLHSMKWIYERPWIAAVSGAIAAPLSYLAGVKLSTAEWGQPLTICLLTIALMWLLLLPLHRFLFLRVKHYAKS
jgi:hypothetical protein